MITENKKSAAGFTLIETIVTLVVAAIIGIFFYTFFSTSIYKSHLPMENLVRANDLNQVMENIRTDYKPYPVWQPNHNYNVNDQVMPTAFSLSGQRYWYQCTQPGTSGSISQEPPWTPTGVFNDNGVTWRYQGPLPPLIDSSMNNLYTFIGAPDPSNKKCANLPNEKCYDQSTNKYGYYVIENGWIDFDLTTKTASTSTNHNILKVTIKNDEGETVTALFFPN
jgi:prepilin-type N-terminal cleavage/methylation domain-containing protein